MWLSGGEKMDISATGLSGKVVNDVFYFILAICVFLLGLITFLMIYFVIRYRKERNPHPTHIEGNVWLEITWTIAPTLLVLAMFYYGLTGFEFLKKVPQGAMVVKVIARQWSWLFEYANGMKDTKLRVPVGKPVKLLINSEDVIHSFYIPAFRIKQDAVPGIQTYLWFQATETGTFDILCAQYCGLEHAHMHTQLIVLPEEEFTEWYQSRKEEIPTKVASRGFQLYQEKGCAGCHSIDGSPRVGPSFKGLFGKTERVMAAGKEKTVVVDEAFIRNYIKDPNVVRVVGYPPIMPKISMTDEELTVLVDYIESLK
jgi:cytochrome c oxidase subunit 2